MNEDWSSLSKKERKKLAKEQRKQQSILENRKSSFGKWVGIGIVGLIIIIGIVWIGLTLKKESGKPLPGKEVTLLGRAHVVGTKVKYNSNPPTSGDHYATWAKSGVHDEPTEDEYLVHSLEHGYVIISYNCENKTQATALKKDTNVTSAPGEEEFNKDCVLLVEDLKEKVKKDSWKLILIPRPNLDTDFALTAWGRIDKFNTKDASMERVNNFIDAFRNRGPEQTME